MAQHGASSCSVVGWDSFHSTSIVRGYCERERLRHQNNLNLYLWNITFYCEMPSSQLFCGLLSSETSLRYRIIVNDCA